MGSRVVNRRLLSKVLAIIFKIDSILKCITMSFVVFAWSGLSSPVHPYLRRPMVDLLRRLSVDSVLAGMFLSHQETSTARVSLATFVVVSQTVVAVGVL